MIPKSMIFGTATPSWSVHEDVGRLEVPVDDALLVGMLDGEADLGKERQALHRVDRLFWSQYSVTLTPRTSSMTKKGRPASLEPASRIFAMLGWSISFASAWRSASKRAMTSRSCPSRA